MQLTVHAILFRLLAFVFASLAAFGIASAEKRVALVVGNSQYEFAAELRNPANDANSMAERLSNLGFEVIKGIDLDERAMRQSINDFAKAVTDSDVALLFYAGHGLQVDGQNYILPINAELKNEIDLQFQGVNLNFLLRIMESPQRTSIVLLDACRDNPLAERLARSMGTTRSAAVSSGLARVESGVGTYIGFSTQPGNVALDGDGENSPFATAILRHIEEPGADIESIMRVVREDVIEQTKGTQVPWGNSSLTGTGFVFNPKAEAQPAAVAAAGESSAAQKQLELTYWNSIKDQNDARLYLAYLTRFPSGEFAELARLKIDSSFSAPRTAQPSAGESTAADRSALSTLEMTYWKSIEDSDDPAFFEAYLAQFPNGAFAGLARVKMARLGGSTVKPQEPAASVSVAESVEEIEARIKAKLEAEIAARIETERKTSLQASSKAAKALEEARKLQAEAEAKVAYLMASDKERPENQLENQNTSDQERGIKVAALDRSDSADELANNVIDDRGAIASIQRELNRLGCDVGSADGIWGNKSREALQSFADESHRKLASLEPTQAVIDMLNDADGRVCPLVCRSGFVEKDGQCEREVVRQKQEVQKAVTKSSRSKTTSSRVKSSRPVVVLRPSAPKRIRGSVAQTARPFQDIGARDP
ncbi:MAG: caspase family protein [Rhizobiaceae bacterium]